MSAARAILKTKHSENKMTGFVKLVGQIPYELFREGGSSDLP